MILRKTSISRSTDLTTTQEFDLPWEPVAKGRPRVTMRGGHARAYTPAKTRTAEAALRYMLSAAGARVVPRPIPITVRAVFRLPRPASLAKRFTAPTKKPDLDNTIKTLADAGNGVLWEDDAQIVELNVRKTYGVPGIWLVVTEVE